MEGISKKDTVEGRDTFPRCHANNQRPASAEKLIKTYVNTYGNRLKFYGETELLQENGWKRFCQEKLEGSIYISIDKDVLNTNSAVTNWDQGSWSLTDFKKCLNVISGKGTIIGIDICGEFSCTSNIYLEKKAASINSDTNKRLLTFFLSNIN